MEAALLVIIVVVVVVGLIAGIWASSTSGEAYRQIGRGGLSLNDGSDRPAHEPSAAMATGEREAEIRQMLEARNARRVARGQAPEDVEAQLAELLRPAVDPALEAEVRQLVIARNARRARAGKPPLDVEAEVARSLASLQRDR
jgi:isoaspartyl peptidase/L-asparaginase-like protein (Ntn-hydrolase superfamily)